MMGTQPELGSIRWAIDCGVRALQTIRSIRSGGYDTARRYFDFYTDKRTAHGAARRAANTSRTLGNPPPYYIGSDFKGGKMIYALDAAASLKQGLPLYISMRHVGRRNNTIIRKAKP